MEIDGHDIQLKHLDKVFFPKEGLTKGDLVNYYQAIAPVMVPLIKGPSQSACSAFPMGC